MPTVGVWQSIRLLALNATVFDNVKVAPRQGRGGKWSIDVNVTLADVATGRLSIAIPQLDVLTSFVLNGAARLNVNIPIQHDQFVQLWWPNGYGAQPLYTVSNCYLR